MSPVEPTRYADGRAMLLAGLRREHRFADAPRAIPAQWQEFNLLRPIPGQLGTAAYGVICSSSTETERMEYMCAVEVEGFDQLPSPMGRMRVPAQRYAVFEHRGHVSTIRETWDAIFGDWLPRSGQTSAHAPDFELYDERFNPATGLGGFEIWVSVTNA